MARETKFYTQLPSSDVETADTQVEQDLHQRSPAWLRKKPATTFGIPRSNYSRLSWILAAPVVFILALIILTPILNPSYTHKPRSYTGGNPHNEKVFIVAAIVDADLIRGAWGDAVLELINAVGPENAFLSIYNNDSGPETKAALNNLSARVPCENTVVSEHLPLEDLIQPELSNSRDKVKRIAYLAEIRNRAMRPFYTTPRKFDKILFLNDVVFSGQDGADLLFATGTSDVKTRTTYHAACAVDFINPIKFYDTFATRDSNGYGMGLPFFPWFTGTDGGQSRRDVMQGSDAVRVKSCWGGMVAFEARWFEEIVSDDDNEGSSQTTAAKTPVRFRSEDELFWESSECCLIHADIETRARHLNISGNTDSNIVMNPFVRVAYSKESFEWLHLTRRFERLYSLPHLWISWLVGLPFPKPRQFQEEGESVENLVWTMRNHTSSHSDAMYTSEQPVSDPYDGCYQTVKQVAPAGGFCGGRQMSVLKTELQPGEKMWKALRAPPLDSLCKV